MNNFINVVIFLYYYKLIHFYNFPKIAQKYVENRNHFTDEKKKKENSLAFMIMLSWFSDLIVSYLRWSLVYLYD